VSLRDLKRRWRAARAQAEVERRLRAWAEGRLGGRPHGLPFSLVVSLTSYPPRFPTLHLTLGALLAQTVRADATILWLGPGDAARLPPEVLALRSHGLEIRDTPDLRSFKKVVPALLAFPEAAIATADDDLPYPGDWLEGLVEAARGDAGAVPCHRAHRIALADGRPAPYANWTWNLREPERGPLVFPTGVMGVLYPPGSLHEEATRDDLFREFCPTADDVWLWWMHRMAGRTASKIGGRARILDWPGSQDTALRTLNLAGSGNDRAVAAMVARYGLPLG
jgi:hypothetical protein